MRHFEVCGQTVLPDRSIDDILSNFQTLWHCEMLPNQFFLWNVWDSLNLCLKYSWSPWFCSQSLKLNLFATSKKKKEMKNLEIEYEVYKSLLVEKVDCSKGLKRCQRFYSHMHSFANFPQVDSQENNNAFNQQGPSKLDRQDSQNGIWIKSKSNSWNSSIINVQF